MKLDSFFKDILTEPALFTIPNWSEPILAIGGTVTLLGALAIFFNLSRSVIKRAKSDFLVPATEPLKEPLVSCLAQSILCFVVIAIGFHLIGRLRSLPWLMQNENLLYAKAELIIAALRLALALAIARIFSGRRFPPKWSANRTEIFLAGLWSALLVCAVMLVANFFGWWRWEQTFKLAFSNAFDYFIITFFYVVSAVVIFQGYILKKLCNCFSFRSAAIISTMLFVIMQAATHDIPRLGLPIIGIGGLFNCYLFRFTGSLWPLIVFTVSWSGLLRYVSSLATNATGINEGTVNEVAKSVVWATGGDYGVGIGLPGAIVLLLNLGLVAFYIRQARGGVDITMVEREGQDPLEMTFREHVLEIVRRLLLTWLSFLATGILVAAIIGGNWRARLATGLASGMLLCCPMLAYQAYRFALPGLHLHERRIARWIAIGFTPALVALGTLLAWALWLTEWFWVTSLRFDTASEWGLLTIKSVIIVIIASFHFFLWLSSKLALTDTNISASEFKSVSKFILILSISYLGAITINPSIFSVAFMIAVTVLWPWLWTQFTGRSERFLRGGSGNEDVTRNEHFREADLRSFFAWLCFILVSVVSAASVHREWRVKVTTGILYGLVFSGPVWVYQVYAYIRPGLYSSEKKVARLIAMVYIFAVLTLTPLLILISRPIEKIWINTYRLTAVPNWGDIIVKASVVSALFLLVVTGIILFRHLFGSQEDTHKKDGATLLIAYCLLPIVLLVFSPAFVFVCTALLLMLIGVPLGLTRLASLEEMRAVELTDQIVSMYRWLRR